MRACVVLGTLLGKPEETGKKKSIILLERNWEVVIKKQTPEAVK